MAAPRAALGRWREGSSHPGEPGVPGGFGRCCAGRFSHCHKRTPWGLLAVGQAMPVLRQKEFLWEISMHFPSFAVNLKLLEKTKSVVFFFNVDRASNLHFNLSVIFIQSFP